ncbi:MAG: putative CoA-binding protein [Gammaproteobacteria bacterium]
MNSLAFQDDDVIKAALSSKRIAVVGLSANPSRPSHSVSRAMQANGYTIIPVNPHAPEILGEPCYARLADIPGAVDIVNVFREPGAIASIVDDAISIKAPFVWLQLGVVDEGAAQTAHAAGIGVIMDRCIAVELRRWKNG